MNEQIITIKEAKKEMMELLNEIKSEAEILVERLEEKKKELEMARNTEEDIVQFNNGPCIDRGFKYIYIDLMV